MHLFPVERTQGDKMQELYSAAASIRIDPSEDVTRQEFKDEADINKLMAKFGVNSFAGAQPRVGSYDFDMDLQQALDAVEQAKHMHSRLPANLREKYPNWESLLNAVESGQLQIDLSTDTESPSDRLARETLEERERRKQEDEILGRRPKPSQSDTE